MAIEVITRTCISQQGQMQQRQSRGGMGIGTEEAGQWQHERWHRGLKSNSGSMHRGNTGQATQAQRQQDRGNRNRSSRGSMDAEPWSHDSLS
jgi:hypothetical protein